MNWSTPALDKGVPAAAAGGHEGHGVAGSTGSGAASAADPAEGIEHALAGARLAGLQDPMLLTPPAAEGAPWRVKESRRSWTAGPDAVSIDPASGHVVQRIDFADFPLAAKLTDWGIRVHMGFLFGLANQLVLAALGVVLVGIVLRGYAMWFARRPARGDALSGRPPVRGALRELARRRPVTTAVAAVAVVAVGWAVPLLGISLVAFLVVDAVTGAVSRRRAARSRAA